MVFAGSQLLGQKCLEWPRDGQCVVDTAVLVGLGAARAVVGSGGESSHRYIRYWMRSGVRREVDVLVGAHSIIHDISERAVAKGKIFVFIFRAPIFALFVT